MSDTKFTPGPWQVRGAIREWRAVFGAGGDICELNNLSRPELEMKANAALIAAAPIGYELAKAVLAGDTNNSKLLAKEFLDKASISVE